MGKCQNFWASHSKDFVAGNKPGVLYVAKNETIGPLAGICGPAIPVQRPNQLSYRVQLSSSKRMFMYYDDANVQCVWDYGYNKCTLENFHLQIVLSSKSWITF